MVPWLFRVSTHLGSSSQGAWLPKALSLVPARLIPGEDGWAGSGGRAQPAGLEP